MRDRSSEFAKFLIEEYRDLPEKNRVTVVRDRFPNIPHDEFMRAFAIAEEIAVADAMNAAA